MALYLSHKETSDLLVVHFHFIVRNNQGSKVNWSNFPAGIIKKGEAWGGDITMTRSEVLEEANDILVEGALNVQVVHEVGYFINKQFVEPEQLFAYLEYCLILFHDCVKSNDQHGGCNHYIRTRIKYNDKLNCSCD